MVCLMKTFPLENMGLLLSAVSEHEYGRLTDSQRLSGERKPRVRQALIRPRASRHANPQPTRGASPQPFYR